MTLILAEEIRFRVLIAMGYIVEFILINLLFS